MENKMVSISPNKESAANALTLLIVFVVHLSCLHCFWHTLNDPTDLILSLMQNNEINEFVYRLSQ